MRRLGSSRPRPTSIPTTHPMTMAPALTAMVISAPSAKSRQPAKTGEKSKFMVPSLREKPRSEILIDEFLIAAVGLELLQRVVELLQELGLVLAQGVAVFLHGQRRIEHLQRAAAAGVQLGRGLAGHRRIRAAYFDQLEHLLILLHLDSFHRGEVILEKADRLGTHLHRHLLAFEIVG